MLLNNGIKASFIYGTAWKKESSTALTSQALKAGFRAIDTAAQPKHYREDLVGEGIRDAISSDSVKREDLFVFPTSPLSIKPQAEQYSDPNQVHIHRRPRSFEPPLRPLLPDPSPSLRLRDQLPKQPPPLLEPFLRLRILHRLSNPALPPPYLPGHARSLGRNVRLRPLTNPLARNIEH